MTDWPVVKAVQPREWWEDDVHMMACLKCGGGVRQDSTVHGMHPSCAEDGSTSSAARLASVPVPSPMERELQRQANAALTEEYRAARKAAERAAAKQDEGDKPVAQAPEKVKKD